MDKYDIEPTKKNLVDSIQKDITGRNGSLKSLIKLLNQQDNSWSIAVNGSWGSDKTFFVKQCQLMLNSLNIKSDNADSDVLISRDKLFNDKELKELQGKLFRTAYYDAWQHDNDEDPITSILNCLATTRWSEEAKETLLKTIDIGISVINATTPIKLPKLKEFIQNGRLQEIT